MDSSMLNHVIEVGSLNELNQSVENLDNEMNIPFSDLGEKEVSFGSEEGVRILQAYLTSTFALTIGLSHLLTEWLVI
ncbi:hypothetical protein CR513_04555, partial [Mucuna pruriens]